MRLVLFNRFYQPDFDLENPLTETHPPFGFASGKISRLVSTPMKFVKYPGASGSSATGTRNRSSIS